MKITYLFLVYKNADMVYRICRRLQSTDNKFLIHVDLNSQEDFSILNSINGLEFSTKRYETPWGSSGLVKATIWGLEHIIKYYETDFVILMSESDYPVKSTHEIAAYLEKYPKDYAVANLLPCEYPLENKNCFWLEGGMRRVKAYPLRFGAKGIASIQPQILNYGNLRQLGKILLKAPSYLPKAIKMLKKPVRKEIDGLPWCGGDQWFILRKSTVEKIVAKVKYDKRILQETDNTIVPDEITLPTLIQAVSSQCERMNKTLRYIHWTSPKAKSPCSLTMADKPIIDEKISDPNILFVRKIDDCSIADYIDEQLL